MLLGRGGVAVIGNDSREIQGQGGVRTFGNHLRGGIKDGRREMSKTAIAGEQVGAEQQPKFFTIETHVPVSVAGEMYRAQSMPNLDPIAVVQQAVGNKSSETQQRAAHGLQTAGHQRPTLVARMTGIVVRVQARRGDPRARFAGDCRYMQDVVQMSVGNDDAPDGHRVPATPPKRSPQKETPSDKSCVQQIEPGTVPEDVEVESWRPDLKDVGVQCVVGRFWQLSISTSACRPRQFEVASACCAVVV